MNLKEGYNAVRLILWEAKGDDEIELSNNKKTVDKLAMQIVRRLGVGSEDE